MHDNFLARVNLSIAFHFVRYICVPLIQWRFRKYRVLSSRQTIEQICNKHVSVSRFGDGEFSVVNPDSHDYRSKDGNLVSKLRDVLASNDEQLLVCLPHFLQSFQNSTESARNFWSSFLVKNYFFLSHSLPLVNMYGDSLFSRFYIDYVDKKHCKEHIDSIRRIWQGQKVLVVEGSLTRSGVGNDLYDGCELVKRLLCPPVDAYRQYDRILSFICDNITKDFLILLYLGVTATAMAYDLHRLGYWAIDIGHIDIEYEWYLNKATKKIPIDRKFVLEAEGGDCVAPCDDEDYLSQIIGRID